MEQQTFTGLEHHKPLTDEQLISKAVLATEIRTDIASNMIHSQGSLRDELSNEHVIAHRREGRLLRAIAARGLMGDFLEADWQVRGAKMNVSEEETVWQAS